MNFRCVFGKKVVKVQKKTLKKNNKKKIFCKTILLAVRRQSVKNISTGVRLFATKGTPISQKCFPKYVTILDEKYVQRWKIGNKNTHNLLCRASRRHKIPEQ